MNIKKIQNPKGNYKKNYMDITATSHINSMKSGKPEHVVDKAYISCQRI